MSNATVILAEEKSKLEKLRKYLSQRIDEISANAMEQRIKKDANGNEFPISYINIDKLTPEERVMFDSYMRRCEETRAKIAVLKNFIKNSTPQEVVQSYNEYVEPLESFKDVTCTCNNIELGKNGEVSKCSINVGPIQVESPQNMSVEEFSQLYTTSLSQVLTKSLGEGLTQEEALQQVQNACSEVYLQNTKTQNSSISL